MKLPVVLIAWGIGVSIAFLPQPARADYSSDVKAGQALRRSVAALVEKDPAAAVAQYQQFIEAHPDFTPSVAVSLYDDMARLHYSRLNDAKAAFADLDAGLAKYPATQWQWVLLVTKGDLLNREGRAAEVEVLLREQWPQIQRAGTSALAMMLKSYSAALHQQHKDAQIPDLWRRAVLDNLEAVGASGGAGDLLLEGLIQSLSQNNQEEEALGWSKLYFQVTPFQEARINKATQLLIRVWTSKNLTPAVGAAFVQSLQDPATPNPLSGVSGPTLDPTLLQEQLARLSEAQVEQRVTLLIMAGRLREAMLAARREIVDHPESTEGALQAARVFKAADLNLTRANAFLEFLRTGTGENPMTAFLQQSAGAPKTGGTPTAPAAPGTAPNAAPQEEHR